MSGKETVPYGSPRSHTQSKRTDTSTIGSGPDIRSKTMTGLEGNREIQEGLLDYIGAARYLCTTPRHVRELWAKRYLAAIKVGRHVRFSRTDLDAFIAARRVNAMR
jgi:excisionase family DNA binding protein